MGIHDLQEKIQLLVADSGATMGIALRHLQRGDEILINADDSFPMASVLKIPVLVEAFRQIDAGKFSLDDRWELTTAEKNLGSGALTIFDDGLMPTVRDLLTLMIIISDNTATDMLIHRIGQDAINQTMHDLGLTTIHLPLTIRAIFESILPSADPTQDQYELAKSYEGFELPPDAAGFSTGPDNNVSTPRHMTDLLEMIFHGSAGSRAACDGMLGVLLKQQLNDRLPRFLPPGTRVAHKTGTLGGHRNDAGIIYVNDETGPDANQVALTIFSKWDNDAVKGDPVAERERIHAVDSAFGHIARAVYDHYAAA